MTRSGEQPIYAFEGFHLDAQHRVLSRPGGEPIPLAPKVFDTLLCFVEHQGELLDKRVLLETIWPHVIVEENNLNQSISTLRRVLGEKPGEHRFIATEPGRGYRFLAVVREVSGVQIGDAVDALAAAPQSKDAAARAPNTFNRQWLLAVAALIAVAVILVGRSVLRDDPTQHVVANENVETSPVVDPAAPTNSIAVLPFVNLSSDPEQEYFSDGLSEELLSNLAQRTDLRVTARSSSFAFKGSGKSIQEVARVLGVAHVLEGSVRRAGSQLRITAQLINAANGYQLWSGTYNRELGDVFAIQEEIAAIVTGSLSATLVAPRGSGLGGTEVFAAYDLYLAARANCTRGTRDDHARCRDYLDQAIELDPDFASAWAAKAAAHVNASRGFPERSAAEQDAAMRAALHAIELEPSLGEAHAALGYALSQQRDLLQAEEEYRKAIALGLPMGGEMSAYAVLQFSVGNIDKAREIFQASRETDPLTPTIVAFLVGSHHVLGDTPAARAEYERGRALFSNHSFTNFMATVGRLSSGEVRSPSELPLEADDIDEAAREHFHVPERALQELRILYEDDRHADPLARRHLAVWAAYFGDPELALRSMKDSAAGSTTNAFMLWFPLFSEARQQPGFKDLMRELGIVAHWRTYGWPKYCRPSVGDDFECS